MLIQFTRKQVSIYLHKITIGITIYTNKLQWVGTNESKTVQIFKLRNS